MHGLRLTSASYERSLHVATSRPGVAPLIWNLVPLSDANPPGPRQETCRSITSVFSGVKKGLLGLVRGSIRPGTASPEPVVRPSVRAMPGAWPRAGRGDLGARSAGVTPGHPALLGSFS